MPKNRDYPLFNSELTQQIADGYQAVLTKTAYGFSALGLFVSGLTIEQITGVAVGVCSIITMIVTAAINYRYKKKLIEQIELTNALNDSSYEDNREG
jgi:hypothetical protein